MNQQARVSLEALDEFRAALLRFGDICNDAITTLQLEARRAAEWVEVDRAAYWPAQYRSASDNHRSAQVSLERCELSVGPDDHRSCFEEKKAVEQTKQRMRLCEEKVRTARHWAEMINHETRDFLGDLSRLRHYLESDLPKAVALLEKLLGALERYAQTPPATEAPPESE